MAQQTDYAWAAGFFDGEGCINLHTSGRYTCLRLVIVQKDIRPLEHFKAVFELTDKIMQFKRTGRATIYNKIVVSGQTAADIIQLMLSYLTLKREVAQVALDFQANVNAYTCVERSAGLADSVFAYRRSLAEKAKWLNTGRWAAAETKPSGPVEPGSDSPSCTDGKGAEPAEMTGRVQ